MKSISIALLMFFMTNAHANIEYNSEDAAQTSPQELAQNRACFGELSNQGCGDPGEDVKTFRSCLHDSFAQLTPNCQKMMTGLYGRKK
jgi:sulfite reductase alpha subunit-like flavoprotein